MDVEFSRSYPAMGGTFTFKCYPQNYFSEEEVEKKFEMAHNEILRIENKFTDFRSSPFNMINELAGVSPCEVDDEILQLIRRSLEISKASKGKFDISFASIGHRWRQYKKLGQQMGVMERKELLNWVDYKKIEIQNNRIFLPSSKMKIGLGGIGKGYAVDRAFEILRNEGLYNFYVNGSGDIRVHSRQDAPRLWRIGIQNPFSEDPTRSVGVVQLAHGSISTSGGYKQYIKTKEDHHIIDAENGLSRCEIVSASVIGEDCVTTDTSGTILMNMSVKEALDYMQEEDLSGFVISSEGKSYLSKKAISQFGIS